MNLERFTLTKIHCKLFALENPDFTAIHSLKLYLSLNKDNVDLLETKKNKHEAC